MMVADEGLNGKILKQLRSEKQEVDWILEIKSGVSDRKVVEYPKVMGKTFRQQGWQSCYS